MLKSQHSIWTKLEDFRKKFYFFSKFELKKSNFLKKTLYNLFQGKYPKQKGGRSHQLIKMKMWEKGKDKCKTWVRHEESVSETCTDLIHKPKAMFAFSKSQFVKTDTKRLPILRRLSETFDIFQLESKLNADLISISSTHVKVMQWQ